MAELLHPKQLLVQALTSCGLNTKLTYFGCFYQNDACMRKAMPSAFTSSADLLSLLGHNEYTWLNS